MPNLPTLQLWQPSLRRRLALLTTALAGGALIGFGLLSYWLIREAKIARLDVQLESQLLRASRRRSPQELSEYVAELQAINGATTALQRVAAGNRPPYQSDAWPAGLVLPVLERPAGRSLLPPRQSLGRPSQGQRPKVTPRTQRAAGETWRLGTVVLPRGQMAIAVSLTAIDREMQAIRNTYVLTIPILLVVIAAGAWILSGRALRPVQQLTGTMRRVTAKGLDQRVTLEHVDVELVELIAVFNAMLARLERSFNQASRFSGDAAHELKTPLAILQGELERMLNSVEAGSPLQQQIGRLLDEVSRLSSIVRKLLLLSLADAGQMTVQRQTVNLSALLVELTADLDWLAPELSIKTEIEPGLTVRGDRDLLNQVLQNLLSNAIKYNLPQGWLRLQARRSRQQVWVRVSNASVELGVKVRDRIFDRFQRGDPSHNRRVEGTGLGLSLARAIARAHGGELQLEPAMPGDTTFLLRLPLATAELE
ncbi:MAG: HAMP domain-containing protein [Spirulinaceae cyanobacterium SM2_1_0]|nr:HAMP domain-containing protein [Spirulinaceae cyanobacterium SM2_1_0]